MNNNSNLRKLKPHLSFILAVVIALLSNTVIAEEASKSWQLSDGLSLLEWLSLNIDYRSRYETLENQFRAGKNGNDQILVQRTNLLTKIALNNWKFGLEIMDSRQAHADQSTTLNTGIVNPLDVLQFYAKWNQTNVFGNGSDTSLKLGRFTMDVGSRRFVVGNSFRNTINAFTGIDLKWIKENGQTLQAFYTLPVYRRPTEFEKLLDNEMEGDNQDIEVKFWGLYYAFPNTTFIKWNSNAELFYFGLNENDSHNRPTRNRDIHTVGGRIYKKPAVNQFDYELETAFQSGEVRSSTAATNREDLDHFAHFQHAELGYSFSTKWSPRLVAQFDYASGDEDPNDSENERFDTLFGGRRFDFGPAGIYGPFSRNNLISPGLRLQLKPTRHVSMFLAHRGYWLAEKKDAWVAAGVRDHSGDSGRFIGQQSEVRFRWEVIPNNVGIELGAANLFKGEFAKDAPNAADEGDPNYFYMQTNFSI